MVCLSDELVDSLEEDDDAPFLYFGESMLQMEDVVSGFFLRGFLLCFFFFVVVQGSGLDCVVEGGRFGKSIMEIF